MPGSTRSYEFAKRLVLQGNTVHLITSNWQNKSKDKFLNRILKSVAKKSYIRQKPKLIRIDEN